MDTYYLLKFSLSMMELKSKSIKKHVPVSIIINAIQNK